MKKIIAIVAARMGSERLQGKVLADLEGKPALEYIIDILKRVDLLSEFVIATTTLAEDDRIESLAKKCNIKIFRGAVFEVLERFRLIREKVDPDIIVRVTGDDPLMDPNIINSIISQHISNKVDYTSNIQTRSYPRGMDTEVFNVDAFDRVCRETGDIDDREHVTLYIRRNPEKFKILNIVANNDFFYPEWRLCIDTEEDLQFVRVLYKNLYKGEPILLKEIIEFVDKNRGLLKINSNIKQRKVKGKIY